MAEETERMRLMDETETEQRRPRPRRARENEELEQGYVLPPFPVPMEQVEIEAYRRKIRAAIWEEMSFPKPKKRKLDDHRR
jgi:hypothetical protein